MRPKKVDLSVLSRAKRAIGTDAIAIIYGKRYYWVVSWVRGSQSDAIERGPEWMSRHQFQLTSEILRCGP